MGCFPLVCAISSFGRHLRQWTFPFEELLVGHFSAFCVSGLVFTMSSVYLKRKSFDA